jgi:hypothetical protein
MLNFLKIIPKLAGRHAEINEATQFVLVELEKITEVSNYE